MKKLTDVIPLMGKVDGDISVEIEVEGENLPDDNEIDYTIWAKHREGSLRGENAEFVLRSPMSLKGVSNALKSLDNSLNKKGSEIYESYRAGIHVHINVQSLSPKQIITFVCAYLILEELLMNWCNETRRGNHFCLRASDAEYIINQLVLCVENNTLDFLNTDEIRYSSINLKSLFKFGSLEFRGLESTKDNQRIIQWCRMLSNIKKNSLGYNNPQHLLYSISNDGYENFLASILEDDAMQFFPYDCSSLIRKGVIIVQDVAFSRDWDKINLNIWKAGQGVF